MDETSSENPLWVPILAWALLVVGPGAVYLSFAFTLSGTPVVELLPWFVGGVLGCLVSMSLCVRLICAGSEAPRHRLWSHTWLPLLMNLSVPFLGPLWPLWGGIRLLVLDMLHGGRIISQQYGETISEAGGDLPLYGSGAAAGLLLLATVGFQPLLILENLQDEPDTAATAPAVTESPAATASAFEKKQKPDPPPASAWERGACEGVVACYRSADYVGKVAGRVTMTIDPNGGVERVQLRLPDATDPIRDCVRAVAERKTLVDYTGAPATLRCEFAGAVSGSVSDVRQSGQYTPLPMP